MTFGIVCGCLPVLPRLLSALSPKISMLWKFSVQKQKLSQWIKPSRFSGTTVKDHPYEVQPEWPSDEMHRSELIVKNDSTIINSAAGDQAQSIAPTEGDPTTDQKSVGVGPNTIQTLKTLHIQPTQGSRHDPDLDIEMQSSTHTW